MTENRTQEEFLINKLLDVSENTIESLVKLREELLNSSKDHGNLEEKINGIIDNQKNIENLLNNFRERKPFDILERIETKQDSTLNNVNNVRERLFNNDVEKDIVSIKTTVEDMKNKEDKTMLWVKILSAISTLAVILIFIYKIAFENTKLNSEKYIKETVKEILLNK